MNYTTGNLLIKKKKHYALAVALNHKKIILFSRYKKIARRLQKSVFVIESSNFKSEVLM